MDGARPSARALDWEVSRLLQDITVASDRYADAAARAEGMHVTDLHALSAVVRHDDAQAPLTVTELGRRLDLSPGAATALVDRLEAQGHVTRARDSNDRRRVTLRSTDAAREAGRRLFSPLAIAMLGVSSTFTQDELAVVTRFLDASSDAIATAGPAPRDPRAIPPEPSA